MSRPLLQLDRVSKRYASGSPVLDGVSLDIAADDFVTFIGPRGCGKSTLLRLIAGLTPLSSGEITAGDVSETDRDLSAFVFAQPGLLPWRTVEKNVRLPLQLHGAPADEQKKVAQEMMKLWGIQHVAARYPVQLTPGNQRRAALARAMVTRPRCLLLDEPFAALDAITRNKLSVELMKHREKRPFAGCLVTHSAAEATFLGKRVVVLSANPGRIQELIDVPQPHPRTLDWRESTEFQDYVSRVRAALSETQGEKS